MKLAVHLQIVGALLLFLGVAHAFFNRGFGWARELAPVSLLTRRIFYVHTFFIALGVVMSGAVSLFFASDLLDASPLSRVVLACMAVFWLCRLLAQFFAYDAAIWRGNRFRSRMHVAFAALWVYVSGTYLLALRSVCIR